MDVKNIKDSIKADIKAEMKPRKLLRTAFVPQTKGLLNPLKESFQIFVTLIAQIFVGAKLISKTHPSATGEARGFGAIWLMIIDASSRLKFKRENIYQLIVFYSVVGMIIFGILDALAFLMHFTLGSAHAAGTTPDPGSLFNETNTSDNGPTWINTMFPYANGTTNATGLPLALQNMLVTYNTALLALGTAFALYQVANLFLESAHHGKFGGNRYSQLHAPLRLVIGIGLLVPTTYGFNSAQLIAIEMAKMGSGLASNVWQSFQNGLTAYNATSPSIQATDVNEIVQKLLVDETCVAAALSNNGVKYGSGYTPTWNSSTGTAGTTTGSTGSNTNGATETQTPSSYVITFDATPGDAFCGSITIPKQISNQYNLPANNYFEQAFTSPNGILSTISPIANDIYHNSMGGTNPSGATDPTQNPFSPTCGQGTASQFASGLQSSTGGVLGNSGAISNCANKTWASFIGLPTVSGTGGGATNGTVSGILLQMQTAVSNVNTAYNKAANPTTSTTTTTTNSTISTDWTQAGYLFLKMTHDAADQGTAQNPTIDVALPSSSLMKQVNGDISGGAIDCTKWYNYFNLQCNSSGERVVVAVMQAIANIRAAVPSSGLALVNFDPNSNGSGADGGGVVLKAISGPMNILWNGIQAVTGVTVSTQSFGQSIFNVMQLGNILMTVASAFVLGGALVGTGLVTTDAGLVVIGIGAAMFPAAFALGVMVPLMPAARFIFGMFTWMMTLFEAVIALPVMALISINFEGEGMFAHGKQGWFLVLQMMLRPVLMIFGLIGAVMIFDTMAGFISKSVFGAWFSFTAINATTAATSVASGNTVQGSLSGLSIVFQTIGFIYFYAITLYACANMSFGLINTIPDRILSWTGLPGGITTGNEMEQAMQNTSSGASGMITGAGQKSAEMANRNRHTKAQLAADASDPINPTNRQIAAMDRLSNNMENGGGGPGGGGRSMDDMHGEALQIEKDRNTKMDDKHGEALEMNKDFDKNQSKNIPKDNSDDYYGA